MRALTQRHGARRIVLEEPYQRALAKDQEWPEVGVYLVLRLQDNAVGLKAISVNRYKVSPALEDTFESEKSPERRSE